jgi:hypothetical protein
VRNPFTGWTKAEQCVQVMARNRDGKPVRPHSKSACQWCALGQLMRRDVPIALAAEFERYLERTSGWTIAGLNDSVRYSPAKFRTLWTVFMREAE